MIPVTETGTHANSTAEQVHDLQVTVEQLLSHPNLPELPIETQEAFLAALTTADDALQTAYTIAQYGTND